MFRLPVSRARHLRRLRRRLTPTATGVSRVHRQMYASQPTAVNFRPAATRCLSTTTPTAVVDHDAYTDEYLADVLGSVKTVAVVGASDNWNRPSYFAMKYMQKKGYRVIPVNPKCAANGTKILGENCYASLKDVPESVDMVDIFRNAKFVPAIVDESIEIGAKVVWMQLSVRHDEAAALAEKNGLRVVMDRCPKIEFSRLFGELGWHGFNSGVISSKRSVAGSPSTKKGASPPAAGFSGFETKSIHAGCSPDAESGARVTPIFQNTSFVFEDADDAASLFNLQSFGNIYGRLSNPTTASLEEKLCTLEGGRGATCTSSGHAAQFLTLFALMQSGDRMVASNKLYGGSITQFGKTIKKFGWDCEFVDVDDMDQVKQALSKDKVKLFFVESLANPGGIVSDMVPLSEAAKEVHVPLVVDNTMATPYLCQPFQHGADLIVHSTTKFLSGHGNAMGGVVIDKGTFDWGKQPDKFPSLATPEPAYHGLNFFETFGDLGFTTWCHAVGLRDLGPTMAPMNAFLTITGIETLALRMDRHVANAREVADYLNNHDKVAWVSYAGLETNKYHELANTYMTKGPGSVFTFGLKGGYESGVKFVENCHLFSHLANIGDTRSLCLHPASTTHRQLTTEQRESAGAGDDVIRLSIGIESASDLVADLDNALAAI